MENKIVDVDIDVMLFENKWENELTNELTNDIIVTNKEKKNNNYTKNGSIYLSILFKIQ